MQSKTTIRYRLIRPRMATIKKTHESNCWQGYGAIGILSADWNVKLYNFGKKLNSFVKCSHTYTIDLAIPLLNIYPK